MTIASATPTGLEYWTYVSIVPCWVPVEAATPANVQLVRFEPLQEGTSAPPPTRDDYTQYVMLEHIDKEDVLAIDVMRCSAGEGVVGPFYRPRQRP
jgi:hypothetical protein